MGIVLLAIGESVIYLACQISKWGEIKKGFCLGIILGCLTAVIVVQIFVCPGAWYYTEDKYEKLFGQDSNLVAVTKTVVGKLWINILVRLKQWKNYLRRVLFSI